MLRRRRLLQDAASLRLCQCRGPPQATFKPSQIWRVPRAGERCSAVGSRRIRWLSTQPGNSRSAAPLGTSSNKDERDNPDPDKKTGWRDMDRTLVKHGM